MDKQGLAEYYPFFRRRKLAVIIAMMLILLFTLGGCCLIPCCGLHDRESVVAMYRENEETFIHAAETGEFLSLKEIGGCENVSVQEDHVQIPCGGVGAGSGASYYGIFYSESDDLFAVKVSIGYSKGLVPQESGFLFRSPVPGSNKSYYVEPLGNHYFYYEAHY